jgi:hypothetical protein
MILLSMHTIMNTEIFGDDDKPMNGIHGALIAAAVTVGLFVTREWIERRRRRIDSANALSLYGLAAFTALRDQSSFPVGIGIKDLLTAASGCLDKSQSVNFVISIEEAIRKSLPATGTIGSIQRVARDGLLRRLHDDYVSHCCAQGITPILKMDVGE